mgnify:CR=1 FL=1
MTEATASKIGSEKLKINADNIKSVLTKNTKIVSRLKVFKAKTIFKAKEAKNRLRPGEVKRYDKTLGRYVSNKD